MIKLQALPRKFKIGAAIIADPSPESDLDDVQRILSQQYPMVRHTRLYLEDGVINQAATEILFEFQLVPVKTKG